MCAAAAGRPPQLAGRALREADAGGVRGVGVYGAGLSAFVALPVPRGIGGDAADAVVNAGGTSSDLPGGEAFHLSIAPLSVVVARSQVARRWYLLAGLATPELLLDAAADLSAAAQERPMIVTRGLTKRYGRVRRGGRGRPGRARG